MRAPDSEYCIQRHANLVQGAGFEPERMAGNQSRGRVGCCKPFFLLIAQSLFPQCSQNDESPRMLWPQCLQNFTVFAFPPSALAEARGTLNPLN